MNRKYKNLHSTFISMIFQLIVKNQWNESHLSSMRRIVWNIPVSENWKVTNDWNTHHMVFKNDSKLNKELWFCAIFENQNRNIYVCKLHLSFTQYWLYKLISWIWNFCHCLHYRRITRLRGLGSPKIVFFYCIFQ